VDLLPIHRPVFIHLLSKLAATAAILVQRLFYFLIGKGAPACAASPETVFAAATLAALAA